MKIGVLAIQGSVIEHRRSLQKAAERLGIVLEVCEVRHPTDLTDLSGIILPGGESTTHAKLLRRFKLFEPLKEKAKESAKEVPEGADCPFVVWGTCAGAILLSKEVTGEIGKVLPETLEVLDMRAERNAYGSQLDSFETEVEVKVSEDKMISSEAIFIRAPKLTPLSNKAEVISEFNGQPIAIRQGCVLATSFHPELTDDTSFHEYFLTMCVK